VSGAVPMPAGAGVGVRPQEDASHYDTRYYARRRLFSLAVQAELLVASGARRVLEVGPGRGVLAAMVRALSGAEVVTLDVDPTLTPGVLGSALAMPFKDGAFDAVACFQMLEHLPFERFVPALAEMRRVARGSAVISLPDCSYALAIRLSGLNPSRDGVVRAWTLQPSAWALRSMRRVPNRAGHYWEIGRRGTPLSVVRRAVVAAGWAVEREFRPAENAYHRFFVLS
jgi:SAM-dependent methyltransferase